MLKRQTDGGAASGAAGLPIGGVIGIAIAGSAILFGILTMIITHFLRSRYNQKKRPRDLDLSDDDNENILEALRSTRPPEIALEPRSSHKPSHSERERFPKEWQEPRRFYGPQLDDPSSMPPAYAFQNTGLRDSWPVVGWEQSPLATSQSVNKYPVINSAKSNRRTSHSAFILSANNEPAWPQPTHSRSNSFTRGNERRSTQWSSHSAKSSISSFKRLSTNRKSISDTQLTSILRSTSQRLRDAQRRPTSRTMSVLSEVPGAPPAAQPPTPSADHRGESREALVDKDDVSLVDSVRSSVLNTISHTPSPQKMIEKTTGLTTESEKELSPTPSEKSQADSLYPSKTPDAFIPAGLSSPSRRGGQSHQKYDIASSIDNSPTKIHQEGEKSSRVLADANVKADLALPNTLTSSDDPFLSINSKSEHRFKSKSIQGPRPLIKQKVVVQQDLDSNRHENLFSPLRVISSNPKSPSKSPPKSKVATIDLSAETQGISFQWSPQGSPLLALPSHQKPTEIRQRGHKRSRTVRLSQLSRPGSVSIVLEEPENESTPPHTNNSVNNDTTQLSPLPNEDSVSITNDQRGFPSIRPPSIPIFQPFVSIPPTRELLNSKRLSDGLCSATTSFYDYYSSTNPFQFDYAGITQHSQSPTPSTKKARRRGCNFSMDITQAKDIALLDNPPAPFSDRPLCPPNSTPVQFSDSSASNGPPAAPAFISQLYGPSSPIFTGDNEPITSSISMLRRMNSEVSAYSSCSFHSDQSKGSPTIPALRGGGLSPTRRGNQGAMNYLNIGGVGVKTGSPRAKKGGRRSSAIRVKGSDCRQSLVVDDDMKNCNALGLKMPTIENLPPGLESLTNLDTGRNRPTMASGRKAPTAQLRPMRSSTSQDRIKKRFEAQRHSGECGQQDAKNENQSEVMSRPVQSVSQESRLKLSSPKNLSPQSMTSWRGSLGLYDEMGFLKSSPERSHDIEPVGSWVGPESHLKGPCGLT